MGVVLTTPRPSHGGLNWDAALEADLAAIAAGINAPASFVSGSGGSTNLNNVTQSGIYQGNAGVDGLTNAPDTVSTFFAWVIRRDANTIAQLAINVSSGGLWQRSQTGGTWTAWRRVTDSSMDTGWITTGTGITAASGWTLTGAKYRILNGVAHLSVQATKATSASPTTNSAGSYSNTSLVNLPAALTPSSGNGNYANVGAAASFLAGGYASSTGAIILTVAVPSYAVPVGATVDLVGSHAL